MLDASEIYLDIVRPVLLKRRPLQPLAFVMTPMTALQSDAPAPAASVPVRGKVSRPETNLAKTPAKKQAKVNPLDDADAALSRAVEAVQRYDGALVQALVATKDESRDALNVIHE